MKGAIVLLCFIAAVFGQCSYYTWDASSSNSYYYDLSSLSVAASSYAYSYSDFNSSTYWIWNVCGNLDSAWNPFTYAKVDCQDDAVACFQYNWDTYSTYYSVGTYSSAVFSDSMYGPSQGVSITYTNGDACGYSYRQSRFEFVCDYSNYYPQVTSIENDYCSTVIEVHTSQACPTSTSGSAGTGVGTGSTGIIMDGGSISKPHHSKKTMPVGKIVGMAIGTFVGTAILCACCVVCCVRRQARCQQRKQQCQEMKNVSYSPVSQQPQPQMQQQPFVHPQFVAPQQYPVTAGSQQQMSYPYPQYYFYVQPQAQPQPQPAKPQQTAEPTLVKLDEVDTDEQLAKKLQAEFDQEAHN